ncbi:MAG: UDP-N-acetylmuramate--L-alanine ligase, partial [Deltaproteobacteria bacterium CG07_land_8_20_14_0_80_38_7]
IGIGGIGMSGIAEILLTLGLTVTGSDIKTNQMVKRLERRGAKIWIGHNKEHVKGAHVVVISSAVSEKNPEVCYAHKLNIPVVPRAEMLAELMRLKYGIAIAGTHGKTTTTSLIAAIVDKGGLDPTVIIGGKVKSLRGNARLGKGDYLIAEADESDRSFLKLSPTIGVITNIDPEHLENYRNFAHLKDAFVSFANKVPFYGSVICCIDHPVVRKIIPKIDRKVITYGETGTDYVAKNITQVKDNLFFNVLYKNDFLGEIMLPMVGKHHVKNALAAIAVGCELDIPFSVIKKALKGFSGVSRRFEILFNEGPVVVDDYAHHPVEISATISAAKHGWPDKRIVVVLQPHRFSRLKALFEDFALCAKLADMVLVMDVYQAGEKAIKGVTSEKLFELIRKNFPKKAIAYTPLSKDVLDMLDKWCGDNDLILFLGAGDITKTAHLFSGDIKE